MLGIDISDRAVKIVWLSNDSQPKLLSYCAQALPDKAIINGVVEQQQVVRQQLLKALRACHISSKVADAAVVSIPEKQSFLRVLEIPVMTDEETSEAVKWEVAQHIPFGLENVYLDWQPIDAVGHTPASGHREVQVGAAQKKVVDALYATLQPLELDIAAFELEGQALVRSLISAELKRRQGLLIIDLGRSATNVIIHDHGALRFTATLPRGVSNITRDAPDHIVHKVTRRLHSLEGSEVAELEELLMSKMEELAAQVHGIAEFYNSVDAQHEVKEIILTGGGANMPGLEKAFAEFFENVHMQRGNPWVNVLAGKREMKPPINLLKSVRYGVALGLALREVVR